MNYDSEELLISFACIVLLPLAAQATPVKLFLVDEWIYKPYKVIGKIGTVQGTCRAGDKVPLVGRPVFLGSIPPKPPARNP